MTNLQKAATINFQRSLSLEETHELLAYVTRHLPAHIDFYNEYHEQMEFDKLIKEIVTLRGTLIIKGTIRNLETHVFDAFQSFPNPQSSDELLGLRFQTIPGYSLEEHQPEVRELWDEVR